MELTNAIFSRRSYRGKYKNIPVPREELVAIMEAGLAAPSGCNKQTTSLIAVDDPKILDRIKSVIDPPVGESAPAAICVLTRRINAYRDKCFAVQDYSAAIENMLLAITALGYASCWYEGHITDDDRICDKMAAILNVPSDYDLVAFLPVGIPETEARPPKKRPFGQRAWFNGFPSGDIIFSRFEEKDYEDVCNFLIALNREDSLHINWNWARWEWMFLHEEMDAQQLDKIGLWRAGERIVGAAIYDMYPGEGCALWLPEYRELAPEILDYAWANLRDDSGLDLSVNVRDLRTKKLLAELGYVQTQQAEYLLKCDLNLLPHLQIPKEYTVQKLTPEDGREYRWLLWQGFDHGSSREEFEAEGHFDLPLRKHYKPELTLALRDVDGQLVAHCGCWYQEGTDYAYVEPVCTIPEYRGQGLGRALVVEALRRCHELGAQCAYVISDSDFYRRLGFADCERFAFWHKEQISPEPLKLPLGENVNCRGRREQPCTK